ncbi:MAG: D-alanyl-D-alanine carboxypeptidase family protein [Lachnospiraceae bacterium]
MYFFIDKKRIEGWKRGICLLLALFLYMGAVPIAASATEEPSLYATAAVLLDADTGRVLYSKNGDAFMANASTTKIMTCILALENASAEDMVEVSAYAASMPKVKLYMRQGEHFKLGDLLYSLMLESHNDSAVAIAEYVGGSMEGFAAMMNEKAREIGCKNTWFITPNGLDATQTFQDDEGNAIQLSHGTCAEDLARIMAYCTFSSPKAAEFLKITETASYSFVNEEGRSFSCNNHNAFLNMMEGAISGKTGFTSKAGYCYVGALERDGKRFTIALLACGWPNNKSYKWADSKALFSYGLENYEYREFTPEVSINPVSVQNGAAKDGNPYHEVSILAKKTEDVLPIRFLVTEGENVEVEVSYEQVLDAPVEKGMEIGKVVYYLVDKNGEKQYLTEEVVYIEEDVAEKDLKYVFTYVWKCFLL